MSETSPATLLDLVDKDDRPIGTIRRRDARRAGAHFRVAHLLASDEDGNVLLQQLAERRDRNPLRWGSSVAAYVHAGETYDETIRRRALEELGLVVSPRRIGRVSMRDERATKFVGLFWVSCDELPPIAEPEHIAAVRFMPAAQIEAELQTTPEHYTATLREIFPEFLRWWRSGGPESGGRS